MIIIALLLKGCKYIWEKIDMKIENFSFTELTEKSIKDSSYLYQVSIEELDKVFGNGFSKTNPEIVNGFVNSIILQNNSHYKLLVLNEIRISIDDLRDMVKHISESL